jgi:hypothetical protein
VRLGVNLADLPDRTGAFILHAGPGKGDADGVVPTSGMAGHGRTARQ